MYGNKHSEGEGWRYAKNEEGNVFRRRRVRARENIKARSSPIQKNSEGWREDSATSCEYFPPCFAPLCGRHDRINEVTLSCHLPPSKSFHRVGGAIREEGGGEEELENASEGCQC